MSPKLANLSKISIAALAWISANGTMILPVVQGLVPLQWYHVVVAIVSLAGAVVALLAESPLAKPLLPAKSSATLFRTADARAREEDTQPELVPVVSSRPPPPNPPKS